MSCFVPQENRTLSTPVVASESLTEMGIERVVDVTTEFVRDVQPRGFAPRVMRRKSNEQQSEPTTMAGTTGSTTALRSPWFE